MPTRPLYEVLSPVGQDPNAKHGAAPGSGKFPPAAPLADLRDKKIGLIWTVFTNGNVLLKAFQDLLAKRFPTMKFVELPPGRNAKWGDYPDLSLPVFARESGIDAAIVTAGG